MCCEMRKPRERGQEIIEENGFMGLPSSVEYFDISFIKRTSRNLKNYKGHFEFTMLLNSLLGLVVVPHERKDKKGFTFDF